jgi:hypothetical protein
LPKYRNVLLLNSYVQVIMRASLLAKQCIDAPSAIDPDFGAQLFKRRVQIDDINGRHSINWN